MSKKNNKFFQSYTLIILVIGILVVTFGCSVTQKNTKKNIANFDEIGFFTEANKPVHYQLIYPQHPSAFVSVNDKDDGGSGETWANLQTELKIREHAVFHEYNGVIVGKLTHYSVVVGYQTVTYYNRYFIPIIYDQEKYKAPLTEYQKKKFKVE